jgi:hypothetical protein
MDQQDAYIPTQRECLGQAYVILRSGGDIETARLWLDMAREIREDAIARRMWAPIVNSLPADKFAYTMKESGPVTRSDDFMVTPVFEQQEAAAGKLPGPDSMAGYRAGQLPYPTGAQYEYAVHLRASIAETGVLPKPFSGENDERAINALIDEIVTRYVENTETVRDEQRHEDELAAARTSRIVRPFVTEAERARTFERATDLDETVISMDNAEAKYVPQDGPAEGAMAVCRNHPDSDSLIYTGGVWRHVSTMQRMCPIADADIVGDPTVHRFANPT